MPQVKKQEEPIEGCSPSGFWRSTHVLGEVFRDRPAPTCAFVLALATWLAVCYRFARPGSVDPVAEGVCVLPGALLKPASLEWRGYLLHFLWPLEPGYVRGFLLSTALLLEGYALEYEVGTPYFAGLLVGLHVGAAVLLLHFQLTRCLVSLEPALAGVAVVMHRVNPKIHTDGLDKAIRVPFAVEPRWHLWLLLAALLLVAQDFPQAFAMQAAGVALGGAYALRGPEVWIDGWAAVRARTFKVGAAVHVALLLFAVFFMPLTARTLPEGIVSAALDGRALSPAWWRAGTEPSAPLLHMAVAGQMSPESYFICKLLLALSCPLVLSPLRVWTKFYAGACALLVMYAMTSPAWQYPHVGFLVLVYLIWAFWKLPDADAYKRHAG